MSTLGRARSDKPWNIGRLDLETARQTDLSGQTAHVPNGTVNNYRKTGPPRSATYETDTMALKI